MSHTHFLYHIVFGTKDRMPLISERWENELYKYLAGIIKNHGGEPIEIDGMPDHVHIFTRLAEIMQTICEPIPMKLRPVQDFVMWIVRKA